MKIGFIGAGNMAAAIIRGMVKNGTDAKNVYISDIDETKTMELAHECGVNITSNGGLVERCDLVVLAVKPHLIKSVLEELKGSLTSDRHTIVSIAAGVYLEMLENFAGVKNMPIIRVMPNVNSAIAMGMSAICKNEFVSEPAYEYIKQAFEQIGKVEELAEHFFPLFGAIAGSSPAFTYLFIDSLAKAAHKAGLPKSIATGIVAQAVLGSAALVMESGKHPQELIDSVCSPGGTTIEGICTLDREGFPAAIVACIDKCLEKDKVLTERSK